eukprot:3783434-Prymnesium_polylepis.1
MAAPNPPLERVRQQSIAKPAATRTASKRAVSDSSVTTPPEPEAVAEDTTYVPVPSLDGVYVFLRRVDPA